MKNFIGIFLSLLTTGVLGQSASQWQDWGDAALARGDHYGATRFYAEALQRQPGQMELQWKQAEACRLSDQYDKAVVNYEKVARKDMGRKHPDALYRLAEMQMCAGDYVEAGRTWTKVLQKEKDDASFISLRAKNGSVGCTLAREAMAAPEEVTIEHLPKTVNTYASEFGGRIGPDSALYFSSLRGDVSAEGEVLDTTAYHVQLFSSAADGNSFAEAMLLDTVVNNDGGNANSAWSTDGHHLYFTRCLDGAPCSVHVGTDGGTAIPLRGIGTEVSSTQPMVARIDDHDVLFFSSDRTGGVGGTDLWMGNLDGTMVTDLRPVGGQVNTLGNECCPYYDAVQEMLYFSSDFLPGLGGYDNFKSLYADDVFGAPENLRYPLNSAANDLYPTFDGGSMSGLFTSNRVGSLAAKGETCCSDIYRFSYPTEKEITPQDSIAIARITSLREKLPIRLYFHNDEPEPRSRATTTAQTYEQTYRAYKGLVPDYHAAWKGNDEGSAAIDAFFTNEVDKGYAQLNDFTGLLRQAMEEGQRIKLVVRGFASPLAESDYNVNLSLRRIQSMINYLRTVGSGIFTPYLDGTAANGGRLTIEKAPYGEYRAVAGVSDLLEDLQGSVYSVGASLERRIEIEQADMLPTPEGPAIPVLEPKVVELGRVPQGEPRKVEFVLRNDGGSPLNILGNKADCGCTTAAIDQKPIPPGGRTIVIVEFNGHAELGPMERKVLLTTDGIPMFQEITITGTIIAPK